MIVYRQVFSQGRQVLPSQPGGGGGNFHSRVPATGRHTLRAGWGNGLLHDVRNTGSRHDRFTRNRSQGMRARRR